MTAHTREVFFADGNLTRAGFLKQAEIHLDTARRLEALELDDKNLRIVSSYLAASYRHQAQTARDMMPFAEVERTITSANDRSPAHQAVILRANPYDGVDYALEVYCEGGDMPSVLLENPTPAQ